MGQAFLIDCFLVAVLSSAVFVPLLSVRPELVVILVSLLFFVLLFCLFYVIYVAVFKDSGARHLGRRF